MKKSFLFVILLSLLSGCQNKAKRELRFQKPTTVYSHGYVCNKWIGYILHTSIKRPNKICRNAFIIGPIKSFNYSDWANPLVSHLGQDQDIKKLHKACAPYKNVILFGTSRGASTIINYLATYKPTNIIGAVVESPFDHLENVAENLIANNRFFKWLFKNRDKEKLKDKIRRTFFKNYKKDGIQPIIVAFEVPKEIPILLISSDEDTLIPAKNTKNIYDSLRQSGHQKAYLLSCKKGRHGRILWGQEGKIMRNVIHAFYKHHNIPHHEPWALEGYTDFMQCQQD